MKLCMSIEFKVLTYISKYYRSTKIRWFNYENSLKFGMMARQNFKNLKGHFLYDGEKW